MKEWYKDFIGVYENILPKDLCEEVINFSQQVILGERDKDQSGDMIIKDLGSNIEHLNPELAKKIHSFFIDTIFPLYSAKYNIFGAIGPYHIPHFKLQKTLPTEGYHIWHCENNGWGVMQRVGVYTIYLNDVEEGGETEFLYQSVRVKPTQGTICIFPSGYTHLHRGNPPLSGEKWILTGWIEYINPKLLENQNLN